MESFSASNSQVGSSYRQGHSIQGSKDVWSSGLYTMAYIFPPPHRRDNTSSPHESHIAQNAPNFDTPHSQTCINSAVSDPTRPVPSPSQLASSESTRLPSPTPVSSDHPSPEHLLDCCYCCYYCRRWRNRASPVPHSDLADDVARCREP